MYAALLSAPRSPLTVVQRPRPTVGAGQVLIRVHACGICYSDVDLHQGRYGFARFPIVPGHEIAGVVAEVGPDVGWPTVGMRVGLPWLYSSCGHCDLCVRGDQILCAEHAVTGVTADGGYAEYVLAPAANVAPIPDGIADDEAAPLMCAGLAVYNGLRVAGLTPGQKVGVIGLGGLGHLAVQYARAMGARVAVLTRGPDRAAEAEALGAEHVADTSRVPVGEALRAWGGADVVLATAPATEPVSAAVPGLAPDGTVVVLGVGAGSIAVSPLDLILGRRRLLGSPTGSPRDLRAALAFAAQHGIRPRITRFRLDEAQVALTRVAEGRVFGRAVLVPSERGA